MISYNIEAVENANRGDAREWALCKYYNVNREAHDSSSYKDNSDINIDGKHISVKSSGFTLMSGKLCGGLQDFNEIWNLFEQNVHSNVFAYVTKTFTVYEMNMNEFKAFMYTFGYLEKESEKNGGQLKIRCRKESQKMEKWLKCHS